jgi:hypothetical protein
MFSSNIVRGLRLKHTWSLTFYGGRILNFKIYLWTKKSPELVKRGIVVIGTNTLHFLVLESIVSISMSLLQWMVAQMKSMPFLIFLNMHPLFLFIPSF